MKKKAAREYRIIGAYDTETTNLLADGELCAFPILHQLALLDDTPISSINVENVEKHVQVHLYRHALDLFAHLDELAETHLDYVPVIMCHNLAFDMYSISSWLARHEVRVLAKSARKPITFTILDENGKPALVIWDTLIFSQQSLERMGNDCGYPKAVGEWDYDKIRTPDTPLTQAEFDYAKRDVYALFAWFGWWLRRNPDIQPEKLGLNVVTKTSVVRERMKVRFESLKAPGSKNTVGKYWLHRNRNEAPKSDDELFTMLACTRGGFTFCASRNASRPFELDGTNRRVVAYDATSQHPAQLVSHYYPVRFREVKPHVLENAFDLLQYVSVEDVLKDWDRPFPVAFNACLEFENLRPRKGTIYERDGIFPLASTRYKKAEYAEFYEDNGDKPNYDAHLREHDYCDSAVNAMCAFGKVVSADLIRVYVTELAAWEIWKCYEFDSVRAIHGYLTGRFTRPSDKEVISVMRFYHAKDLYKAARHEFYENGHIADGTELEEAGIAPLVVRGMETGDIPAQDVEATYLSLKADLNAIFGISTSNQYRRQTVLTASGIDYIGDFGICNAPKNSKVWYQFGQRIVGWSRIAQICAMELAKPYAETFVNGDTDSFKLVCDKASIPKIEQNLFRLSRSLDRAKRKVCKRVEMAFPDVFDSLDEIGHYVREFESERFCASWNKAYCTHDVDRKTGKRRFAFTLAGIPTKRRQSAVSSFIGLDGFADRLYGLGMSFGEITDVFLGYNVTFASDVLRLNMRRFPEWGGMVAKRVTDADGETAFVAEPAAMALHPMSKTVNDTSNGENATNLKYARANRESVNQTRKLVTAIGIVDVEGVFDGEVLRLE